MATYQGRKGSVSHNGVAVAQVTSWRIQAPRDKVEKRVLGQKSKTYELGQIDVSGRIVCELDYGDPAQKAMIDDALADEPTAKTLLLIVSGTGPKQFSISAHLMLQNVSSERNVNIPVEFEIVPAGDLSIAWT